MEIGLGLVFLALLALALWVATEEPAVAAVQRVNPDQAEDASAWDLLGWRNFG
ncbi:MAG TPA: hypothetical protein VFA94_06315 [Acidimicrobiales bacterium]|nr:hypothetical protein [Acidimicrobiales bacterium]